MSSPSMSQYTLAYYSQHQQVCMFTKYVSFIETLLLYIYQLIKYMRYL